MDIYKLNLTTLEREIFSLLCIKTGEKLSQREISKLLKVSPTAVGNSIKTLKKQDYVIIEKTKTINFITINRDNYKVIQLKRSENLNNIYLSGLADYLEETLAGATIIVFGSYSRGEDTKESDIDIAVIERKDKLLNLEKFEKTLEKQININYYNSWKDIHNNLRNNILNGIVIAGSVDL